MLTRSVIGVRCEGKDLASYEDVRARWADHMAEVESAIRDVALFVRGKITSKLDKGYFGDDKYGIPFELDDAAPAPADGVREDTDAAETGLPDGSVVECTGWPQREQIFTRASKTYRIFVSQPSQFLTKSVSR